MNDTKIKKIQSYLNNLFDTNHFTVKKRKNIEDSLEIYIKDEFLESGQKVKGIIIALENDTKVKRALSVTNDIDFYQYKINFDLIKN